MVKTLNEILQNQKKANTVVKLNEASPKSREFQIDASPGMLPESFLKKMADSNKKSKSRPQPVPPAKERVVPFTESVTHNFPKPLPPAPGSTKLALNTVSSHSASASTPGFQILQDLPISTLPPDCTATSAKLIHVLLF